MSLWTGVARRVLRRPLAEPAPPASPRTAEALAAGLEAASRRRLGRSLMLRHVDAGSCNGCELELRALSNVFHDLERLGLRFVASPRHADVLLVTGPLTKNMREALDRTAEATPDPRYIVGVGDCAVDGGVFKGGYAVAGGLGPLADLLVPGCPPTPVQILTGLASLLEVNDDAYSRRSPHGRR